METSGSVRRLLESLAVATPCGPRWDCTLVVGGTWWPLALLSFFLCCCLSPVLLFLFPFSPVDSALQLERLVCLPLGEMFISSRRKPMLWGMALASLGQISSLVSGQGSALREQASFGSEMAGAGSARGLTWLGRVCQGRLTRQLRQAPWFSGSRERESLGQGLRIAQPAGEQAGRRERETREPDSLGFKS